MRRRLQESFSLRWFSSMCTKPLLLNWMLFTSKSELKRKIWLPMVSETNWFYFHEKGSQAIWVYHWFHRICRQTCKTYCWYSLDDTLLQLHSIILKVRSLLRFLHFIISLCKACRYYHYLTLLALLWKMSVCFELQTNTCYSIYRIHLLLYQAYTSKDNIEKLGDELLNWFVCYVSSSQEKSV